MVKMGKIPKRGLGESVGRSKDGMKLVLERFRRAGLSGVTAVTGGSGVFASAAGFGFGGGDENRWKTVWRGLRDEVAFEEER